MSPPTNMQAISLAAEEQATTGPKVVAERLMELRGTIQRELLLECAIKRTLPRGHFGKEKRVAQGIELHDRARIHLRRNAQPLFHERLHARQHLLARPRHVGHVNQRQPGDWPLALLAKV